jgi:hypothetical protein
LVEGAVDEVDGEGYGVGERLVEGDGVAAGDKVGGVPAGGQGGDFDVEVEAGGVGEVGDAVSGGLAVGPFDCLFMFPPVVPGGDCRRVRASSMSRTPGRNRHGGKAHHKLAHGYRSFRSVAVAVAGRPPGRRESEDRRVSTRAPFVASVESRAHRPHDGCGVRLSPGALLDCVGGATRHRRSTSVQEDA